MGECKKATAATDDVHTYGKDADADVACNSTSGSMRDGS